MGLVSLTDFSSEVETSKTMPPLNDHPSSRLSRNGEEYKQNLGFVSPRVYLKIKPASQQQEDNDESTKKPLFIVGWRKDRVKDQSPRLRRVLCFTFKLTSVPDWREARIESNTSKVKECINKPCFQPKQFNVQSVVSEVKTTRHPKNQLH
ncbi:hypothetical protein Tco_1443381 [Tanacetum coccineum]